MVITDPSGRQPVPDPRSGMPMVFADSQSTNARIDELSQMAGMQVYETHQAIVRKARVPHYTEMAWWCVLETGVTPHKDRKYPYVPYVASQYSDDPRSIMGIVRNSLAILQINIFLQDVVQGLLVVAALIIDQFRRGQLTWKKIIGKDR